MGVKIRKRDGKWYVFVNYHGRRKVGRNQDQRRSALPAPSANGREEVLALRSNWRATSTIRNRAPEAATRGHPRCGYEPVEQLG